MRIDDRNELDQILDSALASYSARHPWPGIEQRVINRLSQAKPRERWLRWVVPAPVLAGTLAIVAYWFRPEAPHANVPGRVVQSTVALESEIQPRTSASVARAVRVHRPPSLRPRAAKAAVFPAPSPLTAEERALMQLAVSNPEVLQHAQISRQQWNRPLTMESINIPPLENGESLEN
jgi:hypothetical protein